MHHGPIKLPEPVKLRCLALFNLGGLLCLYTIDVHVKVMEVREHIIDDTLRIHHLQDIRKLCSAISEREELNDTLRDDVNELSQILELFINVASYPNRSCGMWSCISYV